MSVNAAISIPERTHPLEQTRLRSARAVKEVAAKWSLALLCLSLAAAIGGGLYEQIVLTPVWSKSPPSSFAIIQPGTGVPLQRFWIPVHAAITLFFLLALVVTWRHRSVRRLLLVAVGSYIVMRAWSGLFFIPEMLDFQKVPLDSPPSAELSARVSRWTAWTWFREPLDVLSFLCSLLAMSSLQRSHPADRNGYWRLSSGRRAAEESVS